MPMEFGLHSANNAEELCFVLLGRGVGLLPGSWTSLQWGLLEFKAYLVSYYCCWKVIHVTTFTFSLLFLLPIPFFPREARAAGTAAACAPSRDSVSVSEGISPLTRSGRARPTLYELKVLITVIARQRIAAVNNQFPSENGSNGFPHLWKLELRGAVHRARVWWLYKMKKWRGTSSWS